MFLKEKAARRAFARLAAFSFKNTTKYSLANFLLSALIHVLRP